MKDQLADGWTTKPLSEIATFSNGLWKGKKGPFTTAKVLRNTNFRPHGALSLDDVAEIDVETKQLEKRRLQKGDIILERSGGGPKQPVGRVVLFDRDDGIFSFSNFTSVVRITDKAKVEPAYLHQVLNWWHASGVTEGIQSRSTGIRNLDFKAYKELGVPLPPLEEQQRIVAVLDEAFEGLTRARTHAKTNLQNARELFESAVNSVVLGDLHGMSHDVQGDGVLSLKSEQRKRANDKKFRGPRFVGSKGEPELPNGWAWASPEQLCTHIVDCLHATPKWAQDGEVCLRTTNFRVGELDLTETRYVAPETYAQRISRLEPKPGDVLYSREGGILGIACVHPEGLKACLGQRMMHFRLKAEFMLPTFFCAVLNSALVLGEVRHFTGGAAAPHLNIGDIRQFPIPVPPLPEQEAMVQIIEAQTESRRRLQAAYTTKLQDLDDLRQSLLQKAFAGELT